MRAKIGLVLGGGGSRGLAHIGVLDVLHRENIPIDFIVGTSMGAIIGVSYANGMTPREIAQDMTESGGTNIFNMNLFSAKARQRDLQRKLETTLSGKTFDDLNIKTALMTADMLSGEEVVLQQGELIPAILASCAVPAVFPPVEIGDRQLADGGVIDSLATGTAFALGAERVIAVDVYPPLDSDDPWVDPVSSIVGVNLPFNILPISDWTKTPSMASSMWRAVRVMTWYLHEQRLKLHPPDVLLRPDVGDYGSLDFTDLEGPLAAGRLEALRHIEKIKALTMPNHPATPARMTS
ncbi:MAG: patatin-like phospholipase family protein [Anaerolineaceae bacterium]|nr:MAG: patatin-like phospholipase family protein [Anaerolineaceae bacterium]